MKGTLRIRWFNLLAPGLALVTCIAAMAEMPSYHRGRTPSAEEIHAWDIAIGPAGKELPPGSGTATEGAKIYTPQCAHCHGQIGAEGPSPADAGANLWPYSYAGRGRPAPPLLGSEGTLKSGQQVRTLGKFWPVATTTWDYINRANAPEARGVAQRKPGLLSDRLSTVSERHHRGERRHGRQESAKGSYAESRLRPKVRRKWRCTYF